LFFEELPEFSGDWFGDFVGDHFQGGGESVSSAYGAGERVVGLGKFFLKFLEALLAHVGGVGVGKKKTEDDSGPGEDDIASGDVGDDGEQEGGSGAKHEEVSGANVDMALGEYFLEGGDTLGAAQESVEGRDAAEHFVTQESEVRRGFGAGLLHGGEAVTEYAGLGLALIEERDHNENGYGHNNKYEDGNDE
jgi:hypothetical protein